MARTPAPAGHDDAHDWDLANSIQLAPSSGIEPEHLGVVVARPHATGWFISAMFRRGLHADQVALFKEFVTVRVHALLRHGPGTGAWTPGRQDEWVNYSFAELGTADVRGTPDSVPAHWA